LAITDARPVLDEEFLAHPAFEIFRQDPQRNVAGATGRIGRNQPHRTNRPVPGRRHRARRTERHSRRDTAQQTPSRDFHALCLLPAPLKKIQMQLLGI
jgi:hypothetical protein